MSLRTPIKYLAKHYSYADEDAPVLSDIDGAVKTIIKACLVTGYGQNSGAGWESLYEDEYKIVLRMAERSVSTPDIKIENGNNVHRIVSQYNPTSVDDENELASTALRARAQNTENEWHLIATDVAFFLYAKIGQNTYSSTSCLYVGKVQKLHEADDDIYVMTDIDGLRNDNYYGYWFAGFKHNNVRLKNMLSGEIYSDKDVKDWWVPEKYVNDEYLFEKVIVNKKLITPFYVAIPSQVNNLVATIEASNDRLFVRAPEYGHYKSNSYTPSVWFVATDYWDI